MSASMRAATVPYPGAGIGEAQLASPRPIRARARPVPELQPRYPTIVVRGGELGREYERAVVARDGGLVLAEAEVRVAPVVVDAGLVHLQHHSMRIDHRFPSGGQSPIVIGDGKVVGGEVADRKR